MVLLRDGANVYKMTKPLVAIALLTGLGLLSGCTGGARAEDDAGRLAALCGGRGGTPGDPCPVSFFTLAANPDLFDGQYVRVAGYYSAGLDRLLFLDRDSADGGVVANAALLSMRSESEWEGSKPENLLLVEAKFLYSPPSRGEFNVPKTRGLLGELAEAKRVRGSAVGLSYRCWGVPSEKAGGVEQDADCLSSGGLEKE